MLMFYFINNILLMQLGKIKKDYYKAFPQEEIYTKEILKKDEDDDDDDGVAMWLLRHYENLPNSFKNT